MPLSGQGVWVWVWSPRHARRGCESVSATDLSDNRLDIAKMLGASEVDPRQTYDTVFDTVGTAEARKTAMDLTCKLGRCIWMGFSTPFQEIAANELIRSQRTITGAFAYSAQQFVEATKLAGRARPDWVTNLAFTEMECQLQAYLAGDFSTVKAALRPSVQ